MEGLSCTIIADTTSLLLGQLHHSSPCQPHTGLDLVLIEARLALICAAFLVAVVPEEQVMHHALHMGVAQHSRVVTELRVQGPSDQPVGIWTAPAVLTERNQGITLLAACLTHIHGHC